MKLTIEKDLVSTLIDAASAEMGDDPSASDKRALMRALFAFLHSLISEETRGIYNECLIREIRDLMSRS